MDQKGSYSHPVVFVYFSGAFSPSRTNRVARAQRRRWGLPGSGPARSPPGAIHRCESGTRGESLHPRSARAHVDTHTRQGWPNNFKKSHWNVHEKERNSKNVSIMVEDLQRTRKIFRYFITQEVPKLRIENRLFLCPEESGKIS